MLEFPFYTSITFAGVIIAAVGLAGSVYAAREWKNISNGEEKEFFWLAAFTFFAPVFLFGGVYLSYQDFYQIYKFHNIPLSQIVGLKIIKSDDEFHDSSQVRIFSDAPTIREGMKTLKNCYAISRNHESYKNGYKIKLLLNDDDAENQYYLSVYRENPNGKTVVMPHFTQGRALNLGEFGCPEFQDWTLKNIDPLFQNGEGAPE